MKFSIGICGLPNSGKSTFIKLISQVEVEIASYPFTTLKPKEVFVQIITPELLQLHSLTKTKEIKYPGIFFVDVPGLIRGAHQGEGLGNEFLSYLRSCDIILEVVRNFRREDVPHPEGKIDPIRDLLIIEEEIKMSDEKIMSKSKNKNITNLLSTKDWYLLINGETNNELINEVKKNFSHIKNVYHLDLLWELEILENKTLSEEFKPQVFTFLNQFRKDLNLIQFFTFNKNSQDQEEGITQGWFILRGSKMIDVAAMIHSDFVLKFKFAEVISLDKFMEIGSWEEAKRRGLIKIKNKEAEIEENDIVLIKI